MGQQQQRQRQRQGPGATPQRSQLQRPPQPPTDQYLQGRDRPRTGQRRQRRQRRIARQGRGSQSQPKQRPPGQQHLRQPPAQGRHQGGVQASGIKGSHQGYPGGHQQSPHPTTETPHHQTQRQAQGGRHPDPIQRMQPQQPAVADQDGGGAPQAGSHQRRAAMRRTGHRPEQGQRRPQQPGPAHRRQGHPSQDSTGDGGQSPETAVISHGAAA